jgi:hypothetical protein
MIDQLVQIENRASVISLIDESIISIFIKPNLEFEIPDVDDVRNGVEQLRDGKSIKLLVDISENTTGVSEVREYGAKHGANKNAIASAYVTDSLAQKIVLNFYISLYRRDKPSRMFTNKKDAIDWLKKIN